MAPIERPDVVALGAWWGSAGVICWLADQGIVHPSVVAVMFAISLILGDDLFLRPE